MKNWGKNGYYLTVNKYYLMALRESISEKITLRELNICNRDCYRYED